MATKNKVNSKLQVKTINGQRWICEEIELTPEVAIGTWDFVSESDGHAWKKIRPWKPRDLENKNIAGQSQDDKTS